MDERLHYTLSIQSGRHVATQKLVLPKQFPDNARIAAATEIREPTSEDTALWIAEMKRVIDELAPTDE